MSWKQIISEELSKPYMQSCMQTLKNEKANNVTFFPKEQDIFNAFKLTKMDDVKVVILGQDPYHAEGQAHGLSFSVRKGVRTPPSLVNIYKELVDDVGIEMPSHGELTYWAEQGVLLLNNTLTVREKQANSHAGIGWSQFTDTVLEKLAIERTGLIFLLWGKFAQGKATLVDRNDHIILKAAHPSPFSAYNGFFGCKHFSKVNEILIERGHDPIDWQIK